MHDDIESSSSKLMYIEDLIKSIPELADVMINSLLYFAVFPTIMDALNLGDSTGYISEKAALLLLRQIVRTVTHPGLIHTIIIALSFRYIPTEWQGVIKNFTAAVQGFSREWKPLRCENDVECTISGTPSVDTRMYFSTDLSMFLDPTQPFLQKIALEYQKERQLLDGEKPAELNSLDGKYIKQVLDQLGAEKDHVEEEHKRLGFAFGVPVGVETISPAAKIPSILSLSDSCIARLVISWRYIDIECRKDTRPRRGPDTGAQPACEDHQQASYCNSVHPRLVVCGRLGRDADRELVTGPPHAPIAPRRQIRRPLQGSPV